MALRLAPVTTDQGTLDILRALYESDINYSIEARYGGYHVRVGDPLNGWTGEVLGLWSWEEITTWLKDAAIIRYPDSSFARIYRARPE
jgi:hypothetical protein